MHITTLINVPTHEETVGQHPTQDEGRWGSGVGV